MASTYLTRTLGSSSNSGTISMWVKRSKLGANQYIYANLVSGTNYGIIFFDSNDKIEFMTVTSGSHTQKLLTTRQFRDTSAWYHFVFATDTDNSTATNRLRLYVNGVEETAFDTDATGSQGDTNYLFQASATNDHVISGSASQSDLFDGLMTHVHIVPGSQLAPTVFGETDSTSGIWVPKTAPSVTYTAQGSFLKFENSGAMGTDSSGNSNTWTVGGSMTQNVDTPSNVFATLNKSSTHGNNTLSFGSLRIAFTANTSYTNSIGTLGINSGRWYVEAKVAGATTYYPCIGFCSMGNNTRRYYDPLYTAAHLGADEGTGYFAHGNIQKNGSTDGDYATFTTGDIISMYLDLESGTKTMKYYKNDSLIRSTTITPVAGQFYTFGATGTSGSDIVDFNFGSGFFGTTAVTSANADANGFGAFEYSPTLSGVNYYALNTKNLKEFG